MTKVSQSLVGEKGCFNMFCFWIFECAEQDAGSILTPLSVASSASLLGLEEQPVVVDLTWSPSAIKTKTTCRFFIER